MKNSEYSAVIIGSGISGLYAALKIEQQIKQPDRVLLITKSKLEDSNSYYAQGGMVAVLKENKADSVDSHVQDTLKAGAGLSEEKTVKFISQNSDKVVRDLLKFGVQFDKSENGEFTLTREAAHSVRRILHSGGDATGREMEIALCEAVKNNKNIKIYENTSVVEILTDENSQKCYGVITFNNNSKEYGIVYAQSTILATGGIGQLYRYTTNPIGATGDGFAIGYNAGAVLQDMEFVQFHPTALAIDNPKSHNRFLISEAVRGEGGKLCTEFSEEFMAKYDSRKELAPRDIVARAIFSEMSKNNLQNVYLNASVIGKDKLYKRFPTIAAVCMKYGIDIAKDFIPVAPAAHYFMGGIKTDLNCETSIKNLYAIGEVSSTGLHGANRLASNSLLECVVCAYKVGTNLKPEGSILDTEKIDKNIVSKYSDEIQFTQIDTDKLKTELKNLMWENVGIYRSEESLKKALYEINNIEIRFNRKYKCQSKEEYELRNMLTTAKLIVKSALNRKESRGAHYRTDYLNTSPKGEHSVIIKNKGEINFVN